MRGVARVVVLCVLLHQELGAVQLVQFVCSLHSLFWLWPTPDMLEASLALTPGAAHPSGALAALCAM